MNVRNCKRCSRIFTYNGKSICPSCLEEEQKDFDNVREYLFSHPNSTTLEVSEGTGVDIKTITRFLKEGRLESENMKLSEDESLTCEKCQKPISSGRFCDACIFELQDGFTKAAQSLGTQAAPGQTSGRETMKQRMHTYDVIKKQN